MTITLEITEDREKGLRERASQRGQDPETFLLSLLDEEILFGDMEPIPENDPQEHEEALAGIRRAAADFAAGRHRPAEKVFADMEARYGIPG